MDQILQFSRLNLTKIHNSDLINLQILCDISFGALKKSKKAILTILQDLNIDFGQFLQFSLMNFGPSKSNAHKPAVFYVKSSSEILKS